MFRRMSQHRTLFIAAAVCAVILILPGNRGRTSAPAGSYPHSPGEDPFAVSRQMSRSTETGLMDAWLSPQSAFRGQDGYPAEHYSSWGRVGQDPGIPELPYEYPTLGDNPWLPGDRTSPPQDSTLVRPHTSPASPQVTPIPAPTPKSTPRDPFGIPQFRGLWTFFD